MTTSVIALSALWLLQEEQLLGEHSGAAYQQYRTQVSALLPTARLSWPRVFVTDPAEQIVLLRRKYVGKDKGRIALPRSPADLWAQHHYSVLARGPRTYRRLRRVVARSPGAARCRPSRASWRSCCASGPRAAASPKRSS